MKDFFRNFCRFCSIALATLLLSPDLFADFASLNVQDLPRHKAILIGHLISLYEPEETTLNDDVILNGSHDSRFAASENDLIGRGFTTGASWLRFEIFNSSQQTVEIILESRYPMLDQVSLFQKSSSGTFQKETQGDGLESRPSRTELRIPVFTVNVQPGKNVYFLKIETNGSKIMAFYLSLPKVYKQHITIDTAVTTLFFGVLFTLLLYNGFLMISLRNQPYKYYTVFILAMICVQLSMQGIWPMLFEAEFANWAQNRGFLVFSAVAIFASTLMTMKFLNTREHMPIAHKIYVLFLIINILAIPMSLFLNYNSAVRILAFLLLIGTLFMVGNCLFASLRGYRPAYFYGFSWTFAAISNILILLVYQGIAEIPELVQWGILPGTICEGILMSLALGDRVNYTRAVSDRTINKLNLELQNHLTAVEAVVAERTETIRTIIDNVASGFLMIDADFTIAAGFTKSCRELLKTDLQAGQNLLTVLSLDQSQKTLWRMALAQIFMDELPIEVSLSQIPTHVSVNDKYLHLSTAGIRHQDGKMGHLLLTITDATELRRKTLEAKRNRNLVKTMRNIEEFRQFISYSHQAIENLKIKTSRQEILFILHSLKGNCLVFHLPDIANFVHKLEEKAQVTNTDIEALAGLFHRYLTRHANLLRTGWGEEKHEILLDQPQLQKLREISQLRNLVEIKPEIDQWIDDISAKLIRTALQALIINAKVVAKKLNKSLNLLVIDRDARIRSHAEGVLIDELLHVVRNAIVHGIEDDREVLHKSKMGTISLDFREAPEGLYIVCSDDGRGFERKLWEAECRTRFLAFDLDLSRVALVDLLRRVSQDGFSTEKNPTLFAGRGVGIGALFAAVESCQGRIDITSEAGKGTRYEIFIPRNKSLRQVS